jgi:uncharacterized lipoprotein YehR (DUF1307 family)
MQNSIARRMFLIGFILVLSAAIGGCGGPKVDGKYVNSDSGFTITFTGTQATLDMGLMGKSTSDYTISGTTITVKTPAADTVITINSDGTLTGPQGAVFKKAS